MRKKQYLSLTGQLAENFKPSRRAGIVEIDEKIVGDKRKSVRPAEVIFDRSHAQGQIELIG